MSVSLFLSGSLCILLCLSRFVSVSLCLSGSLGLFICFCLCLPLSRFMSLSASFSASLFLSLSHLTVEFAVINSNKVVVAMMLV